MIKPKDLNNKIAIEKDKENFIDFALSKGVKFNDVLDYMGYYENLKSYSYNIKQLKSFIKK